MDFERECLISLNAYSRLYPQSFFRRPLENKDLKNARNSLVFLGFCIVAPVASEKKDYFVILKMIEQDVEEFYCILMAGDKKRIFCRFEEVKKAADKKMLEKFGKFFSEEEKKFR
jgi:hypothetical protein